MTESGCQGVMLRNDGFADVTGTEWVLLYRDDVWGCNEKRTSRNQLTR